MLSRVALRERSRALLSFRAVLATLALCSVVLADDPLLAQESSNAGGPMEAAICPECFRSDPALIIELAWRAAGPPPNATPCEGGSSCYYDMDLYVSLVPARTETEDADPEMVSYYTEKLIPSTPPHVLKFDRDWKAPGDGFPEETVEVFPREGAVPEICVTAAVFGAMGKPADPPSAQVHIRPGDPHSTLKALNCSFVWPSGFADGKLSREAVQSCASAPFPSGVDGPGTLHIRIRENRIEVPTKGGWRCDG